jgi:hypothetical protein
MVKTKCKEADGQPGKHAAHAGKSGKHSQPAEQEKYSTPDTTRRQF